MQNAGYSPLRFGAVTLVPRQLNPARAGGCLDDDETTSVERYVTDVFQKQTGRKLDSIVDRQGTITFLSENPEDDRRVVRIHQQGQTLWERSLVHDFVSIVTDKRGDRSSLVLGLLGLAFQVMQGRDGRHDLPPVDHFFVQPALENNPQP